MNYYEDKKNVIDYIKMCEGYDGIELINKLENYLSQGATVLELGMGPGTDLDLLNKIYKATGSDNSETFLREYLKKKPDADVFVLNAITMDTERRFKCIFSNKVLHHLDKKKLKESINNQAKNLEEDGVILHTFWKGDREESMHGMKFTYYTEEQLTEILEKNYHVLEMYSYTEIEENDSICLLAKKKKKV